MRFLKSLLAAVVLSISSQASSEVIRGDTYGSWVTAAVPGFVFSQTISGTSALTFACNLDATCMITVKVASEECEGRTDSMVVAIDGEIPVQFTMMYSCGDGAFVVRDSQKLDALLSSNTRNVIIAIEGEFIQFSLDGYSKASTKIKEISIQAQELLQSVDSDPFDLGPKEYDI